MRNHIQVADGESRGGRRTLITVDSALEIGEEKPALVVSVLGMAL